jgi:HK97 family phage major capsid protein
MEEQVKAEIKTAFDEVTADVKKDIAEVKSQIQLLADRPIQVVKSVSPQFYKGYKLSSQLEQMRDGFSNPDMADGFAKAFIDLAEGAKSGQRVSFAKAAAAHNESSDAAGGALVIEEFDRMLVKMARENSVMMPLIRNVSVNSTDTLNFAATTKEVGLTWDAVGTRTIQSSTFERNSIAVKDLSGYIAVENNLLNDNAYDLSGEIAEQFAYAMAQEIDNQVLNGTGSPCSGVLTAKAGYSVTFGTAGSTNWSSVTGDTFSLAIAALASGDAARGTFVVGKKGSHYVRTLKDDNGNPIYQALSAPDLNKLFGYNIVVANKINDATGGTGGFYGVFGDFSQFYLVNRVSGLELLVDPYSDSISGNTRFVFSTRKGLGLRRANAFVRIGCN